VWAQLCEAADAFVIDYWVRAEAAYAAEAPPEFDYWWWIEEADMLLWQKSRSRHTERPSLIYEWWAERVGGHQAKKAIRFWQQAAVEPEDPEVVQVRNAQAQAARQHTRLVNQGKGDSEEAAAAYQRFVALGRQLYDFTH
jgi:hypothetical protein